MRVLLICIQISVAIKRVDFPVRCSYGRDSLGCQCNISREAVNVNVRETLFFPPPVPVTNDTSDNPH